jgi:hypothetical protein
MDYYSPFLSFSTSLRAKIDLTNPTSKTAEIPIVKTFQNIFTEFQTLTTPLPSPETMVSPLNLE